MKIVTVYTTPSCQQCKLTKRKLDQLGVPYATVDLTENPDDMAAVKELGYTTAPVVIVSNGNAEHDLHWGGYRPDLLTKYAVLKAGR